MTSILVVCTGNICRSPMAEGLLRETLGRRLGAHAPRVTSAGTSGWEGSEATRESVQAARERGVDIARHVARRLTLEMIDAADLVLCMTREHRDAIGEAAPQAAGKAFTFKELVGILERMPMASAQDMHQRVAEADALRIDLFDLALDQDVADPLGQPIEAYRSMAFELADLTDRLVKGLFGREHAVAAGGS